MPMRRGTCHMPKGTESRGLRARGPWSLHSAGRQTNSFRVKAQWETPLPRAQTRFCPSSQACWSLKGGHQRAGSGGLTPPSILPGRGVGRHLRDRHLHPALDHPPCNEIKGAALGRKVSSSSMGCHLSRAMHVVGVKSGDSMNVPRSVA